MNIIFIARWSLFRASVGVAIAIAMAALSVRAAQVQADAELVLDQLILDVANAQRGVRRGQPGSDPLTERQMLRERFESTLKARVEKLDLLHGLSSVQKKKLVLAGRADIDRYFERFAEVENQLLLAATDRNVYVKLRDQIARNELYPSRDILGERSMFAKVLANTLTQEQVARHHALERENAQRRHQGTIHWVLGTWDQTLALSPEQHQRLKGLLEQATRPPRKFGTNDYFGVLLQLSRLPEDQLEPIFRPEQWQKLQPEIANAKQMAPELEREGYVPERDVAAAPPSGDTPANAEKKRG
jgi:hypothetical protein